MKNPVPKHWSHKQRLDYYTRIDESGCHIFTGTIGNHGYGRLRINDVEYTTHRLAWALANGPIPKGLHILHNCDVRACVNPAHLRLGTNRENVDDMMSRGRWGPPRSHPKGSSSPVSKLTEKQALELYHSKEHAKVLAKRFCVSPSTVYMIRGKKVWAHIHEPPFRA
jgi:hypothetical protein